MKNKSVHFVPLSLNSLVKVSSDITSKKKKILKEDEKKKPVVFITDVFVSV